ncbi:homologous-pairing protein 2 homolog isoform X2 [Musca domestica]|uniref:Homologous-pairing protein 2 homolog n=3 Tax=Musca domestica TaxID=7370 RepID=A0A9J7IJ25_MUSDO|nr:homologous-pairing protein 2 homolog isoform X2 [Musca domestica]
MLMSVVIKHLHERNDSALVMVHMSKPSVVKIVQEFMLKANRPYAINDVVDGCGKDLGKSAIQKSLDSLVDKDILIMKMYGKNKIYFPKQNTNTAELKKDVFLAKQKLAQVRQVLKSKENQLSEMQTKLRSLSKIKTVAQLEEEKENLMDDIRNINERLRHYEAQEKEAKLSAQDVKKIEAKYANVSTAYRKRKRICTDMLDAILEGYPKTKKALIADIGLETDDDVGFKIELKR